MSNHCIFLQVLDAKTTLIALICLCYWRVIVLVLKHSHLVKSFQLTFEIEPVKRIHRLVPWFYVSIINHENNNNFPEDKDTAARKQGDKNRDQKNDESSGCHLNLLLLNISDGYRRQTLLLKIITVPDDKYSIAGIFIKRIFRFRIIHFLLRSKCSTPNTKISRIRLVGLPTKIDLKSKRHQLSKMKVKNINSIFIELKITTIPIRWIVKSILCLYLCTTFLVKTRRNYCLVSCKEVLV